MKKLIFLFALALAVNARATGAVGPNTPQSGVINLDASTGLVVTNTFPFTFTTPPAVIVNGLQTNNQPFLISAVTISNWVLTVSNSATTNASVAWQAYAPYPRLQFGTCTNAAAAPTNFSFPFPYAFPPTVSIEGNTTNANGVVAITAVTTTNFSFLCNKDSTNQWQAIGQAYTPGTAVITY